MFFIVEFDFSCFTTDGAVIFVFVQSSFMQPLYIVIYFEKCKTVYLVLL